MGWVVDGHFDINHATLLCASSLVTATVASLILGSLMVAIIVLSRRLKINPDNIATPIAASLGDLVTLALLSAISSFLHKCLGMVDVSKFTLVGHIDLLHSQKCTSCRLAARLWQSCYLVAHLRMCLHYLLQLDHNKLVYCKLSTGLMQAFYPQA